MTTRVDWTEEEKHFWDVELPADIQKDKSAAETFFRAQGYTWAWLHPDDKLDFVGHIWFVFLKNPSRPCRRIVRLSFPGEGQLRVIHRFDWYHERDTRLCEGESCFCKREPVSSVFEWDKDSELHIEAHLRVTLADQKGALHRYLGMLMETECKEANATAVVFGRNTPQPIADQSARLFELTNADEDFYALLDSSNRCAICSHLLRDEVSKMIGVGPDCAERYGIPHTLEAASKRTARRKELLGKIGTGESQ